MFSAESDFKEFFIGINKLKDLDIGKNKDILRKSGEELKKVSKNCFLRERSPDGVRWKPLMKSTLRIRKSKNRILDINGKLKKSVSYKTKDNEVTVFTPFKYGAIHQYGYKKSNLVARPFIGINNIAKGNIERIVVSECKRMLDK